MLFLVRVLGCVFLDLKLLDYGTSCTVQVVRCFNFYVSFLNFLHVLHSVFYLLSHALQAAASTSGSALRGTLGDLEGT